MIELPEAANLATQINNAISGIRITGVVTQSSPHKFAWFHRDPGGYSGLLRGRTLGMAKSYGGLVEIEAEDARLLFGDGVSLRIHGPGSGPPEKHQLLVEFEDSTILTGSVQMYGGLWAFPAGTFDNPYYHAAVRKPSPLTDAFDMSCFTGILRAPGAEKLSVKALLATEQRIPGLGNGVLQDILWNAGIHPRRKAGTLSRADTGRLFHSIRSTLKDMRELGGRDTEKDLFGKSGGYTTRMSRKTVGKPCPKCSATIERANYMGGAVTFCPSCQVQQG